MFVRLSTLWWRLLTDNAGPSAAEYALLLAASVAALIAVIHRAAARTSAGVVQPATVRARS